MYPKITQKFIKHHYICNSGMSRQYLYYLKRERDISMKLMFSGRKNDIHVYTRFNYTLLQLGTDTKDRNAWSLACVSAGYFTTFYFVLTTVTNIFLSNLIKAHSKMGFIAKQKSNFMWLKLNRLGHAKLGNFSADHWIKRNMKITAQRCKQLKTKTA